MLKPAKIARISVCKKDCFSGWENGFRFILVTVLRFFKPDQFISVQKVQKLGEKRQVKGCSWISDLVIFVPHLQMAVNILGLAFFRGQRSDRIPI
jgi:hypothetical protein